MHDVYSTHLSVYLLDFKDIRDYSLNTGAVENQTPVDYYPGHSVALKF